MLSSRRESNSCSFVFIRGSFLARILVEGSEAYSVCVLIIGFFENLKLFGISYLGFRISTMCHDRGLSFSGYAGWLAGCVWRVTCAIRARQLRREDKVSTKRGQTDSIENLAAGSFGNPQRRRGRQPGGWVSCGDAAGRLSYRARIFRPSWSDPFSSRGPLFHQGPRENSILKKYADVYIDSWAS